jgi:tellurite resistance protein TehA-like permease
MYSMSERLRVYKISSSINKILAIVGWLLVIAWLTYIFIERDSVNSDLALNVFKYFFILCCFLNLCMLIATSKAREDFEKEKYEVIHEKF